jgi:glycosyltransferase involved in cell wall biosynthesis
VVGGAIADGVEPTDRVITFPGVVDDAVREQLFAAADLVVLSFIANYPNESGTLMDAIAAGVPVVCCDDAAAAQVVRDERLGATYAGDDPAALAAAVRAAPSTIDPDDLAAARHEHSHVTVVRNQLQLMDIEPPVPPSTG